MPKKCSESQKGYKLKCRCYQLSGEEDEVFKSTHFF